MLKDFKYLIVLLICVLTFALVTSTAEAGVKTPAEVDNTVKNYAHCYIMASAANNQEGVKRYSALLSNYSTSHSSYIAMQVGYMQGYLLAASRYLGVKVSILARNSYDSQCLIKY